MEFETILTQRRSVRAHLSLLYNIQGLSHVVVRSVKQGCVGLFVFASEEEANSHLLCSHKRQLLLDWVSSCSFVWLYCKLGLRS